MRISFKAVFKFSAYEIAPRIEFIIPLIAMEATCHFAVFAKVVIIARICPPKRNAGPSAAEIALAILINAYCPVVPAAVKLVIKVVKEAPEAFKLAFNDSKLILPVFTFVAFCKCICSY
jgi:hypothetical protein